MSKRIENITVGTDPEVFLAEEATGRIVSAIPYIMGDKYNPYPIPGLPEGCCIQTDNIMIEYCIPPSQSSGELYNNFQKCLDWTKGILPVGLVPKIQAFAHIDPEFLDHPNAQRFGCERDFNAWKDGMVNPSPKGNVPYRSCGGHIHCGWDNPEFEDQIAMIKALDIFLGIPSILLDTDKERKKLYGKAGACRFKSYGVEWRTPSNFWLASQELTEFVFEGIKRAVEFVNTGRVEALTDEQQLRVQTCINTGDEELAIQLIHHFGLRSLINKIVTVD